ncbi:anaerobic ribonucleoside-triphosphate reductase activating protein [Spirochaetia bacterium 38H-sp]|uniref:Anaerobic ribonucleoside-triphosphate reductase activating protein n=1 Tax=Rarispira pelagica TaxID=3141764 RepID=A0ABU9UBD3_9SPIR
MLKKARLGIIKTSFIDYPGKISTLLFTGGCNLRCPYCHNPELIEGEPDDFLPWQEIKKHLEKRKNLIEGIAITGGEPLIKPWIEKLIIEIKQMGYPVKLDTNGTLSEKLAKVLPILDYIAMDYKTLPDMYNTKLGAQKDMTEEIKASLNLIAERNIPHEIRITTCPTIVDTETIEKIAETLPKGIKNITLAGFRPEKTLDPALSQVSPYPQEIMESWKTIFEKKGINCRIRINKT